MAGLSFGYTTIGFGGAVSLIVVSSRCWTMWAAT